MSTSQRIDDAIIVALDFRDRHAALELVDMLGLNVRIYKVGVPLLTAEGPELVRQLVRLRKRVFLDLKLHETPHVAADAVAAAADLGVGMVSVHASGGGAMLRAAVNAARAYHGLQVIAHTVMPSVQHAELRELGVTPNALTQVRRMANLAESAGCHGVITSPHEVMSLRHTLGRDCDIIAAGVHLPGHPLPDHARSDTPLRAIRDGARRLLVGRTITQSRHPLEAWHAVRNEVMVALASLRK